MVLQYKCPNCGADMVYDSNSGLLACNSCGHTDVIDKNKVSPLKSSDHVHTTAEQFDEAKKASSEQNVSEYHCNNCGAVILTDADTTATTCSFCGAGVVLGDRLSGALAPAKVIPFTISKEQAQESFKKWCKKGLLTPKGFMTADRIKSITGIYVPFWLFDLHASGDVNATCTKIRSYTRGDYRYTETSYFDVYRQIDLTYLRVPADASTKMNDELMDKLEPFDYSQLKDFQTPYLAGFIAEKYNYNDRELYGRVLHRAQDYTDNFIHSTISGYASTNFHHKNINITEKKADYTLLPVWMVCYDYKKSEHIFAMNGQTGKIVGTPPLSIQKILAWGAGISTASFLIIKLIAFLIGGVLW